METINQVVGNAALFFFLRNHPNAVRSPESGGIRFKIKDTTNNEFGRELELIIEEGGIRLDVWFVFEREKAESRIRKELRSCLKRSDDEMEDEPEIWSIKAALKEEIRGYASEIVEGTRFEYDTNDDGNHFMVFWYFYEFDRDNPERIMDDIRKILQKADPLLIQ